jgi:hemoglobin
VRALAVLAVVAACSKQPTPSTPARPAGPVLYDRLGRMDVIKDIVRHFVEQSLVKGPFAARFTNVDVPRLEDHLATQLCELSGGPCKYTGRSMRDAHASLALGDADFTAFLALLQQSLAKHDIERAEQDELLGKLRALRDQIVAEP